MSLAGNDPNHQHQQHSSSSSSAGPPSSPRYHQSSSAVASPAPSSPTSSPWPQTPHRQSLHHHQTPQPPALPTSPLRPESYYLNPTRPHPMGAGSMISVPLAASRRPFLDSPVSDSAVSPTPSPPPSVPPTTLSSSDLISSFRPSAVELLEDEDESMDDDDEEQIGPDDPRRFERRITPSGQAYYVDHHLRTTAWELCVLFYFLGEQAETHGGADALSMALLPASSPLLLPSDTSLASRRSAARSSMSENRSLAASADRQKLADRACSA